jgi:uncharacterized repeat protein (TIGR01451 family)
VVRERHVASVVAVSLLAAMLVGLADPASAAINPPPPVAWVARGATVPAAMNDVAVDASGNTMAVGWFSGTVTFGSGAGAITRTGLGGTATTFVTKLDPSGAPAWVVRAGGVHPFAADHIVVDGAGNTIVAGPFNVQGSISIGAGPTTLTVTNAAYGSGEIVFALGPNGVPRWARFYRYLFPSSMRLDTAGTLHFAATFPSTIALTVGDAPDAITLTPLGPRSGFVVDVVAANGAITGGFAAGASGWGLSLTDAIPLPGGDLVLTGRYYGPTTFGTGPGAVVLPGATTFGIDYVFLARFSAGSLVWAKQAFGNNGGKVVAAVDAVGDVTVASAHRADAIGDALVPAAVTGATGVVVSYTSAGALRWAVPVQSGLLNTVAMAADGHVVVGGRSTSGGVTFGYGVDAIDLVAAAFQFVGAIDSGGGVQWAAPVHSDAYSIQDTPVAISAAGDAVVGGNATGTLIVGSAPTATTIEPPPVNGVFVARFGPAGAGPVTDLALDVSPTPIAARGGDAIDLDVTVHNNGSVDAPTTSVVGLVPPGFTAVATSSTAGSFDGTTWAIGTVPAASAASMHLVLTAPAGCTFPSTPASIMSGAFDPHPGDNTASQYTRVTPASTSSASIAWARTDGGHDNFIAEAVATDAAGDVYVVGTLNGPGLFGTGPNAVVLGTGSTLAKYLPDGQLAWAQNVPWSEPRLTVVSGTDVMVSGGIFQTTVTVGSGPTAVTISSPTTGTGVLARFHGDGTVAWARGGYGTNYLDAVVGDLQGDLVVTAYMGAGFSLPGPSGPFVPPTFSGAMRYVAGLSPTGDVTWVREITNSMFRPVFSPSGELYAAMSISSTSMYDGVVVDPTMPIRGGDAILRIAPDHSAIRLHSIVTSAPDLDLAVGGDGAIVVGGISGQANFVRPGLPLVVLPHSSVPFLARYEPDGTFAWAHEVLTTDTTGNAGIDSPRAEAVGMAADGSAYLFGRVYGPTTFGAGADAVTLAGDRLLFLARYRDDGRLLSAQTLGAPGWNQDAYDLTVDPAGNPVTVGYVRGIGAAGTPAIPLCSDGVNGFVVKWRAHALTSSILGTATDAAGAAAPGVTVSLMADWPSWVVVATTTTDASGNFRFDGVAPGTYRLKFFDASGRWARTWYQSSPTYMTGVGVLVSAAADVAVSQHLTARTGGALKGHVQDAGTGAARQGIVVQVFGSSGYVGGGTTGAFGNFHFDDLVPGTYRVRVVDPSHTYQTEWYEDAATAATSTPIVVNGAAVTISIAIAP